MAKRNWIVSVSSTDDDPLIFGPYVEARAKELAEKFNSHDFGDDFEFIRAGAYPIGNPGIREILRQFGR